MTAKTESPCLDVQVAAACDFDDGCDDERIGVRQHRHASGLRRRSLIATDTQT
jgi:hypothetical protein